MKSDFTDDEEDLEALRLAALSSLKKKNEANDLMQNKLFTSEKHYGYAKGSFRGGKRRFFSNQSGRNNRNGQFNNQVRNSNLISIPTSSDENPLPQPLSKSSKFQKTDEIPKLVRPQDRYANKTDLEIENEGPISKFDRYDNWNSESEEDDEISNSKLERTDSLEALMEELDAEIQGEPKKEKKEKIKIKKEKTSTENNPVQDLSVNKIESSEDSDNKVDSSSSQVIIHKEVDSKVVTSTIPHNVDVKKTVKETVSEVKKDSLRPAEQTFNKQKQRSPGHNKLHNRRMNGRLFNPETPAFISPVNTPIMIPNPPYINSVPSLQFTTVYNAVPPFTGPEVFPMNVPPPTFVPPPGLPPHILPLDAQPTGFNVPPLHPLAIEPLPPLSSIPMGPLSPRSAAFVLQNRAIVEKRKRSPRRSFSRSPSPPSHRLRYSKSPPLRRSHSPLRRSLSPLRRSFSPLRRSLSPRRSPGRRSLSPYRRNKGKSPRRDSPRRSPRRTRDSPKRSPKSNRDSPKRTRESRRTPVKDRLGARGKNEEKDVKKKEETVLTPSKKTETKPLDPILEARKKKFESKEIKVKEGVIRLKPKEETNSKEEEISSKPKKEDLKIKDELPQKPKETIVKPLVKEESTRIVLLPKNEEKPLPVESPKGDQLEDAMKELEMLLKDDEALELTAKVDELFTDEETDQENESRFKVKKATPKEEKHNVVPLQKFANGNANKASEKKREATKSKWIFEETKKDQKVKKMKKEPLTNPIENRKIEIKIRNPSKYEKSSGKVQSSIQISSPRKIGLVKKEEFSEEEDEEGEPEIVEDNEEDEEETEEVAVSKEGDLRAQLSRKRAERQNKLPTIEGVQSRLLQSALEGAVFKKKKSKKKEKASKDVKLPIHLRLGIAHDSDIFAEAATEKISRKKSKRRKHLAMEQV